MKHKEKNLGKCILLKLGTLYPSGINKYFTDLNGSLFMHVLFLDLFSMLSHFYVITFLIRFSKLLFFWHDYFGSVDISLFDKGFAQNILLN